MFKIIGDTIYYDDEPIATIRPDITPSTRDDLEYDLEALDDFANVAWANDLTVKDVSGIIAERDAYKALLGIK